MKTVTKYSLCALVSIGLACSMQAKQDDEKEDKEKKDKVPVVEKVKGSTPTTDKPFSVPDSASTVALLGLSLAAVGWAHRRWKSSPQRP